MDRVPYEVDDDLEPDLDYGTSDEYWSGNIPDPSLLRPRFLSAARAAVNMPKLLFLTLELKYKNEDRAQCEIIFAAPGVPSGLDHKIVNENVVGSREEDLVMQCGRVFCGVNGLSMENDFVEVWEQIGKERGFEMRVVELCVDERSVW